MSHEEEVQKMQDTITVLQAELRGLRSLQEMDLKIEVRKAIDQMSIYTQRLLRLLDSLEERDERSVKGKPNKRGTIQPRTPDGMPKRGSARGSDTVEVSQVQETPTIS